MSVPPAEPTRPKDLVFTLFGEYLLEGADSVWVGSLIALLEPFGLSESGVRTVLSRMTKKGWLTSRRRGRNSFYSLTPRGRRLLREGQARIFHPTWNSSWDGRWTLLAYSIPEDDRRLRDRLRDRLAWLGFGSVGNGLWLSPNDVTAEVEELARTLELQDRFVCFRAEQVAGESVEELVARAWDLAGLNARYRDFARRWTPVMDEVGDAAPGGDRCFALRFHLIHEYRAFPLRDPYLPRALLPEPWHGDEATEVFLRLHDGLVGPADAYVADVLASAPPSAA